MGETSDNLPGVPGVGPKTAAKWITAYDGLENIIERAGQVPGKAGQSLREHLDDVRRNRRLNRLLRDLELPVELPQTERRDWDREAITQSLPWSSAPCGNGCPSSTAPGKKRGRPVGMKHST